MQTPCHRITSLNPCESSVRMGDPTVHWMSAWGATGNDSLFPTPSEWRRGPGGNGWLTIESLPTQLSHSNIRGSASCSGGSGSGAAMDGIRFAHLEYAECLQAHFSEILLRNTRSASACIGHPGDPLSKPEIHDERRPSTGHMFPNLALAVAVSGDGKYLGQCSQPPFGKAGSASMGVTK